MSHLTVTNNKRRAGAFKTPGGTMARKAKTPTTIDQTEVDEEVQTAISDTVNTASAHSEKILTTYGDGEQFFDLHLSELKAREAMERGAQIGRAACGERVR